MSGSKAVRRAFTLIELLVVVAIIALLIAILMPSLARARENAKATGCLLNLKNIGVAFASYLEISEGIIPPAQIWQDQTITTPGRGRYNQISWPNYLRNQGGLQAPNQLNSEMTSSQGTSILRCPSGENFNLSITGMWVPASKTDPAASGFWRYYELDASSQPINALDTWYGINGHNFGSTGAQGYIALPFQRYPRDGNGYNQRYALHRTWENPAAMAVLFDGVMYFQTSGGATVCNRIQARHSNWTRANFLLADWHAEAYDVKILPTILSWSTPSNLSADPKVINPNGCYSLGGPRWSLRQSEGVP